MSNNTVNEHIKKIMSKSEYVLESPSYRPIIDDDYDAYDTPNYSSPKGLVEADPIPGDEEAGNIEAGNPMAEPLEEPLADPMADPNAPAPDAIDAPDVVDAPAPDSEMGMDAEVAPEAGMEAPVEETNPDELQNEIIKQNIEVMKQLNQKIESLEAGIDGLAQQNQELNFKNDVMEKEVDEVREPTNVEKLMSKKEDSHPYYYGLNDMWDGNWFQARRDEQGDMGMKQIDDGSYIADFDEMDQMNDSELNKSFN